MTIVECEDGVIRHKPFPSFREAEQWAEWGHCCTTKHTFRSSYGNLSNVSVLFQGKVNACS